MAYNPFDFFRKNQKILFAVLTVFIMIMFTLSWGGNDFFQWFPRWLGTRASGETMAVVDGSRVRSSELEEIQRHRRAANLYMLRMREVSAGKMMKRLRELQGTVSAAPSKELADAFDAEKEFRMRAAPGSVKELLTRFVAFRPSGYIDLDEARRLEEQMRRLQASGNRDGFQLQFLQFQMSQLVSPQAQQANIREFQTGFAAIAKSTASKPDELEAATLARSLIALDSRMAKPELYFTDVENANPKDAMDFFLWRKKADQLGVRFTADDVGALVEKEFPMIDKEDRAAALKEGTEDKRGGPNAGELLGYLTDEFRVRAAQQAVLGVAFLRTNAPAVVSPDQDFARFREATEAAYWSVAGVPVDKFLAEVKGEPTNQELLDIFRKGQNYEWGDPTLNRPAFKKPRELKVAWLELTANEPYYFAAADSALANNGEIASVAALLVAPTAAGPLGQVAGLAYTKVPDKLLIRAYEQWKASEERLATSGPGETIADGGKDVGNSLAAAVGGPFGPTTDPKDQHLLPPQLLVERLAGGRTAALYLATTVPTPLGAEGFGSAAVTALNTDAKYPSLVAPKVPPLEAVRGQIAHRVREAYRTAILPRADLDRLMKDTRKAVDDSPTDSAKGRADAKAILDKFIADRKLAGPELKQVGESRDFATIFSVGADPGLEPLLKRFLQSHGADTAGADSFGRSFFKESVQSGRGMPTEVDSKLFFTPRTYPEAGLGTFNRSQFLVWMTDERPSVAPADVKAVQDKVVAEWRRQKARALAKAKAEELAKKVAGLKADEATLLKEWPELAKQVAGTLPEPGFDDGGRRLRGVSGGGYTLDQPDGVRKNVKYATPKMIADLADNRTKPLGATHVHADLPENTFYVSVLVRREAKVVKDYADAVFAPAVGGPTNQAATELPAEFADQARRAALEDALELLRSEYGYKDESPRLREKQPKE